MENANPKIKTVLTNDGYSKEEQYFSKLNRSLIEKIKLKEEREKIGGVERSKKPDILRKNVTHKADEKMSEK